MVIDAHSHLGKNPDFKIIAKMIDLKIVDGAWISADNTISAALASREEMLAVKKQFAPFFKIFAYLDFYAPPDEIKRLKDLGFDGLKSIYPGKPYNHPDWFPFYERAEREKMPILFHTGSVSNPPRPVDREFWTKYSPDADGMRPIYLDIIAKLFPDLVLIAGHFGSELWRNEAMDVIYNHRNVYADLSGINSRCLEGMNNCMNRQVYYDNAALISAKLLFGVDVYYGLEYACREVKRVREFWERYLEVYGSDKPWGRDKNKIMGETAVKIFGCK